LDKALSKTISTLESMDKKEEAEELKKTCQKEPLTPLQVPSADTFVALNNLFRLQKEDGSPVRTVVTMGVPGSGMSVCVAKFSLDWAQQHANREFMAALYVFLMFYIESTNVLDTGFLQMPKFLSSRNNSKSAAGLVQCAVERTLSSQLGRYDMFLRYLCGLLSPHCHYSLLRGFLYSHNTPKVEGLAEVQQVLDQSAQTAPEDRRMNLYECLREMTQEDD
ncbi:hypothetical protein XENOCAPTIV_000109, partial [Xenoophorus captivus]